MISAYLLYLYAGALHVWTLLTIAAFFYFPVYLDTKAARIPRAIDLSWLALAPSAFTGAVAAWLYTDRGGRWIERVVSPHLRTPVRVAALNVMIWTVLLSWRPAGIVLWDSGREWAAPLYLTYWTLAGFAAYSLSLGGGIAYFTGCAQILESRIQRPPSAPVLYAGSLYRFTRHPFVTFMIAALWSTPLMTMDRLVWASLWTVCGVVGVEVREKRLSRIFGPAYEEYRRRVPKWIPFYLNQHSGGSDDSQ